MQRITYFTAGPKATAGEIADIALLNAQVGSPFEVLVVNGAQSSEYGYGVRETDYVAGTVPAPYDNTDSGEGPVYLVFDPDDPPNPTLPDDRAVVANGDTLTAVDGGTIAVAVAAGVATYTYTAP